MTEPGRGEAVPLRDNAFSFLVTPQIGRREETLLCKIPTPLAMLCGVRLAQARSLRLCFSTRVYPEFRVSSNVSTWATADPEGAFPSPLLAYNIRLAPVAPRPAGSRSLRNPGKGHSLGVATRGLLGRQQPILVRHTRASANQRPYCSRVPPAPALFSCFPCPVPVIAAVAAAAARAHRSLGTGPSLALFGFSCCLH